MSTIPQVVFWQNMPAHHQVGALDRLASFWGAPVTCVWCGGLSSDRVRLGWPESSCRHAAEIRLPEDGWRRVVAGLVSSQPPGSINVFSGIGAYSPVTAALLSAARRHDLRVLVMAESPVMLGWRRLPRYLKAAVGYGILGRRLDGLLAIGSNGERFFSSVGVPAAKTYPFAYQSPLRADFVETPEDWGRIAFVGQLQERKGADLLLAALQRVAGRADFRLDVYGDGSERGALEKKAGLAPLAGRVRFHGAVPSARLAALVPAHAFAVVPSRFDGWGMAVNEALQSGVPVIASAKTGASDLVRSSGAGEVFRDEAGLEAALFRRLTDRGLLAEERRRARAFAPRISPESVGDYLGAVLRHVSDPARPRPFPPWSVS
ncbi:MAG: hypothetical protein RLZZ552_826 [Verrucomicrobiota bacterium]|jgi:glycosyltransferase involved in cell wall biosynthesis